MKEIYLAIDLGASSGRHIVGYKNENDELILDEVYRFKNSYEIINNHKVWNIDYLFKQIKLGIKEALRKYHKITSLSIDTWGVDYVLLKNNKEIYPVYCYRDERTKAVINQVHSLIPFKELYKITGTQFQEFNTIYQLYEDLISGRLNNADEFLMLPEYFIYKLTNIKVREYTNASTTGLFDINKKSFSKEIISRLGFNDKLFNKVNYPGEEVGYLKEDIAKEVGGNILVKLCATHDTASAIEGISLNKYVPYISSGTWSLLGVKLDKPITSEKALKFNYSNELGPTYVRFQKNIMGLWIIQNLSKEYNIDFINLVNLARKSSYKEIFDVNDSVFLSSNNMDQEIKNYFIKHNKIVPCSKEDVINSALHSLAYSYKVAIMELEEITSNNYKEIYIIGGGAKNKYLNELTSFYTSKKIIALEIEASSIGNLLVQMGGKTNE